MEMDSVDNAVHAIERLLGAIGAFSIFANEGSDILFAGALGLASLLPVHHAVGY